MYDSVTEQKVQVLRMKIMAIDYGDAHTGIAISDYTETLAGYSDVIHSRKQEEVLSGVQRLIAEHGVELLVLGYPRNMDGTVGVRAEKCAAFAEVLRQETGTSGAPPSTPTTSSSATGRTPKSAKRPWTRWRRR